MLHLRGDSGAAARRARRRRLPRARDRAGAVSARLLAFLTLCNNGYEGSRRTPTGTLETTNQTVAKTKLHATVGAARRRRAASAWRSCRCSEAYTPEKLKMTGAEPTTAATARQRCFSFVVALPQRRPQAHRVSQPHDGSPPSPPRPRIGTLQATARCRDQDVGRLDGTAVLDVGCGATSER